MRAVTREWLAFYAQLGLKLFPVHGVAERGGRLACTCGATPCERAGKHPVAECAPHGFKDATADLVVLEQWWTRFPGASVGIATGSGLVVVDIDPGKGGDASLAQLRSELGGQLDTSLRVRTGGGGQHLYFRADKQVGNRVGLLDGIDLRGDGGYVVAPPSRHISGGSYSFEGNPLVKLADLPVLPVRFLQSAAPSPTSPSSNGRIGKGQRNDALASLAGSLRRYAASGDVIERVIQSVNADLFDPPLTPDELRRTVASVGKYQPQPAPQVQLRRRQR